MLASLIKYCLIHRSAKVTETSIYFVVHISNHYFKIVETQEFLSNEHASLMEQTTTRNMNWGDLTDGKIHITGSNDPCYSDEMWAYICIFCHKVVKVTFGNPSGKHTKLHKSPVTQPSTSLCSSWSFYYCWNAVHLILEVSSNWQCADKPAMYLPSSTKVWIRI